MIWQRLSLVRHHSLTRMPELIKLALLFALTALAEIVGCYLPWLVVKGGKPLWLLVPAAASLALFAWLLTLHPAAAGRTYAAYGGMYIAVALLWLRFVDGVHLSRWDVAGAALALAGMAVIALQPRG
jgi:small multidrug resistance family-3 protein